MRAPTVALTVCAVAGSCACSDSALANCREMLGDMRALAVELNGFQSSQSFKIYGFGLGGPHHGWLDRAKELQRRHENRGPFISSEVAGDDIVLPGEITGLGISKASCASTTHCDLLHIADIERRLARMQCRKRAR